MTCETREWPTVTCDEGLVALEIAWVVLMTSRDNKVATSVDCPTTVPYQLDVVHVVAVVLHPRPWPNVAVRCPRRQARPSTTLRFAASSIVSRDHASPWPRRSNFGRRRQLRDCASRCGRSTGRSGRPFTPKEHGPRHYDRGDARSCRLRSSCATIRDTSGPHITGRQLQGPSRPHTASARAPPRSVKTSAEGWSRPRLPSLARRAPSAQGGAQLAIADSAAAASRRSVQRGSGRFPSRGFHSRSRPCRAPLPPRFRPPPRHRVGFPWRPPFPCRDRARSPS